MNLSLLKFFINQKINSVVPINFVLFYISTLSLQSLTQNRLEKKIYGKKISGQSQKVFKKSVKMQTTYSNKKLCTLHFFL